MANSQILSSDNNPQGLILCEACSITHSGSYGSGRFCSSRCARSFSTSHDRIGINLRVATTSRERGIRPPAISKIVVDHEPYFPVKNTEVFSTLSTDEKGRLAETLFEAECIQRRIDVAKPICPARYDYLAKIEGSYKRVQIKWSDGRSKFSSANVIVDLSKAARSRGKRSAETALHVTYSRQDVDLIIAYLPRIERFVLIGPDVFHEKRSIQLRLAPSRCGHVEKCNSVADFVW